MHEITKNEMHSLVIVPLMLSTFRKTEEFIQSLQIIISNVEFCKLYYNL